MILTFNYYLQNLKKEVLTAVNEEPTRYIDPLLVREFKKALKRITLEDWQEIGNLFEENINYLYTYEEQMTFTIVTSKLGLNFLTKDPEYCSMLISALCLSNKSPRNYPDYAKILLSKPLYTMIKEIKDKKEYINYFAIFDILLFNIETPNIDEEEYNLYLKELSKVKGENYRILINESDSILDIYFKLQASMHKLNTKKMIFDLDDFDTLNLLLKYDDEKIKDSILQIEEYSYSVLELINNVLCYIKNYKKIIPFTRRRTNDNHQGF